MSLPLLVVPSNRIGFGTLQLASKDAFGLISDIAAAERALEMAVSQGVRFIDTAWYYGPDSVNLLLASLLRPYRDDLMIVGKIGNSRGSDLSYIPSVSARDLSLACDRTLRTLRLDSIPLLLLRWRADLDQAESFETAWHTMLMLRDEGKALRVGLSNVSLSNIIRAQRLGEVHAVSNAYSLFDRSDDHIIQYCAARQILFLAYYPLLRGRVSRSDACREVAMQIGATPAQIALAWLLARSPVVAPIPGSSRGEHVRENCAASTLMLSEIHYRFLNDAFEPA